jgi:ABC-type spermidine/putrescine transport system permease subunit I
MAQVVLVKIAAMFLVIVDGWLARRRGFLAAEFTQLLRTVDAAALRAEWFSPLLSVLMFFVAYFVGLVVSPLFSSPAQRNTLIFLVTVPNWAS